MTSHPKRQLFIASPNPIGDRANGSCMDFRPLGIPLRRGILRPFVGRNPLCSTTRRRPGARPSSRSKASPDAASGSVPLSDDGTRRGRANFGDHRCPGRRARVVPRRRFRRCMEVCRQRRDVPPRFRLDARAGDRRTRRRPVQAVDRLGRYRRGLGDSRRRPDGRRHLQVRRLGRDLAAHGPRGVRTHRPHHRPSDESERRLRLRARPSDRRTDGARRLSHHRRRQDVEARAVARRELRLFRSHARREESEGAVRRHVARDHAHVGDVQRDARSEGRRLRDPRRRRHMEAGRRPRTSPAADRQDRRGRRPVEFEARVCARFRRPTRAPSGGPTTAA